MNQQEVVIHQSYGRAQAIQQGFIYIAFSQVASNSKMPWEGAVALMQKINQLRQGLKMGRLSELF